ncbi:MAG: DUF63 family protein [Candidatus Aenigmatarchaeota archaeon]
MSILDYFLYPKKSGYDVPKTLTYGIVFILAIFIVFKILKKLKIKIDKRLALAISPYIVFGGTIRVLQDAKILNSYLFVTPGIYFFVFCIIFPLILIFKFFENKKGIPYHKPVFLIGIILASIPLPFLEIKNFYGILLFILFYAPWVLIFYFFKKWNLENKLVTLVQMFDASITFTSIQFFGFGEQHILPTFLINIFSPISFIFAKLLAVILVLILIDKFSDDKEFNNFLKLCIGILGGATGTRDLIALATLIA